jgi:hypothetical protein
MTKKEIEKLLRELYIASKDLCDSCGDNYGSESADNGEYSKHFSDKAQEKLEQVLRKTYDVLKPKQGKTK